MDIASTVYQLSVGIVNFISEHEDKDDLHEHISAVVVQIQNVVGPLMLRDLTDEPLKQVLQSLCRVLSNVDAHLRSWKESRTRRLYAFVNPWAVTQEIREDRLQLMHQYIMLMGAMQIVDHVKGYNLLLPDGADPQPSSMSPQEGPKEEVKELIESSTLQFWRSCIGRDFEIVGTQQFCRSLAIWLGKELGNISQKRLLLRLDENNTGHVTLKALQDLVGDAELKKVVNLYTSDPAFPLLVWISDDLSVNKPKVAFAQRKGVCVVQLSSTKTAKAWLKINKDVLQRHDNPGDLRFISDQYRRERNKNGTVVHNSKAGEEITNFIRNESFRAPLLIYTTRSSVKLTRYVESYALTGSIGGNYKMYTQFISSLAARRRDDKAWIGFNR